MFNFNRRQAEFILAWLVIILSTAVMWLGIVMAVITLWRLTV